MPEVRKGHNVSIGFATSSFAAQITSVAFDGVEHEIFDAAHMGSTDVIPKLVADLADMGTATVEMWFDPDLGAPPLAAGDEVITITFPPVAAQVSGATIALTGQLSGYSWTAPRDGQMTGSYTMVINSAATYTPGS